MSLTRRTGMLLLGYLKLVLVNLLGLGLDVSNWYIMYAHFLSSDYGIPPTFLALSISTVAILVIDTCFCVVLLVGTHKRSQSVLRVYFWLAIVGVIVAILRTGYIVANNIIMIMTAPPPVVDDLLHHPNVYASIFWFGLADIAIQITLLVFVRGETRSVQNTKDMKKENRGTEMRTA